MHSRLALSYFRAASETHALKCTERHEKRTTETRPKTRCTGNRSSSLINVDILTATLLCVPFTGQMLGQKCDLTVSARLSTSPHQMKGPVLLMVVMDGPTQLTLIPGKGLELLPNRYFPWFATTRQESWHIDSPHGILRMVKDGI
jgi:hypothetical protein